MKTSVGLFVGLLLLATPLSASAQTMSDAQRQVLIVLLQKQVQILLQQIQVILESRLKAAEITVPIIETASSSSTVYSQSHNRLSCDGLSGAGDAWADCVSSSYDSGMYGQDY